MLNRTTLAQNIRKYRNRKGLSQTALAAALYVTPQTVSKWEAAISIPDLENLCAMAQVLGIPESELLGPLELPQKILLGIDGGGTKTEFVLVREDGFVLYRLRSGSSNPNVVGLDGTQQVLQQGIDLLTAVEPGLSGIFAGVAGAGTGSNGKLMQTFLEKQYRHVRCEVGSDIVNVIASVRGMESCTAVICGTGSAVFGCSGGVLTRFGGFGYLLEGAGSGFDMGRDVLQRCLACHDGFAEPSALTRMAEEKLGAAAFDSIQTIYREGVEYIASFAPVALAAAKAGDEAAREILRRNMLHLGKLIRRAQECCGCGPDVIFAGGVSHALAQLEPYLLEAAPGSRFVAPEMPPVFGACMRCLHLCAGGCSDEIFEENFKRSYPLAQEVNHEI